MGNAVRNDHENDKPTHSRVTREHESCPHCGVALSPWQQVLLRVDRALVCKQCWYKIILDAPENAAEEGSSSGTH